MGEMVGQVSAVHCLLTGKESTPIYVCKLTRLNSIEKSHSDRLVQFNVISYLKITKWEGSFDCDKKNLAVRY
mgnify:CR=1 FL=1